LTRTLVIVPRMYTRGEFAELCPNVPEDLEARRREFWSYVAERLSALAGRIRWVYRDGITEPGEKSLNALRAIDPDNFAVVDGLLARGAELQVVEDGLLLAEAQAWKEMAASRPTAVVEELLEASLRERVDHVAKAIDVGLRDDEVGVLFLNPSLEVAPPQDARAIRMYPFHPRDYLASSRARQAASPQAQG